MKVPAAVFNEFDAARQEMLVKFRRMICMDAETAVVEAHATEEVLRGLLVLEGALAE